MRGCAESPARCRLSTRIAQLFTRIFRIFAITFGVCLLYLAAANWTLRSQAQAAGCELGYTTARILLPGRLLMENLLLSGCDKRGTGTRTETGKVVSSSTTEVPSRRSAFDGREACVFNPPPRWAGRVVAVGNTGARIVLGDGCAPVGVSAQARAQWTWIDE